jgi:hypothetical protein
MRHLIREISRHVKLYRDDKTGIAWVEDGRTGLGHSCHPNISATGSLRGMKSLGYWAKEAKCVRSHGFIYNTSVYVVEDALDQVAGAACQCGGQHHV